MSLQVGQEVWYIENFEIKSGPITHFDIENSYGYSSTQAEFIKHPVVNNRTIDEYFVYETRESAIYHLKYTLQAELNEVHKQLEDHMEKVNKLNTKLTHLNTMYTNYF